MKITNTLLVLTNIVIISVAFLCHNAWKQSVKSAKEATDLTEANNAKWQNDVSLILGAIEKNLIESNEEHKNAATSIKNVKELLSKDPELEYRTIYTDRESDTLLTLTLEFNALGKDGWKYMGYCMNDGTNGRVVLFGRKRK